MSSLFGALSTAVSGLTAQSSAFGNISDNVANSQTVGYKRTDTSFGDYLTTSNQVTNDSGFVTGRPDYRNDAQGTITSSDNATALAISGSGFFQVTHASTNSSNTEVLSDKTEYTRDGDFKMDKNGYLVNDTGEALNGWVADPVTGIVNQTTLQPIKVNQGAFSPIATSEVTLSANLPATPSATAATTSQVNVYDSTGALHTVSLNWTQNGTNDWTVSVNAPDATNPNVGTAEVKFGPTSGNTVNSGTIGSIGSTTGAVGATSYSANGAATLSLGLDFGQGTQPVSVSLGNYGSSNGVTQFAGSSYTLNGVSQNGVPAGAFSSVTTQSNGNIVVNYDNGQSRTVAQVPIVQFANVDGLQRQDGQAFTATTQSGGALVKAPGSAGAGTLVTNSVEGSNTDIATEFTKLIVAQRAYSANTKMVTTADDMLQQTIDMKR